MYQKNKAVLLIKLQTAAGTDAAPTNINAYLVEEPSIEPISKKLERNNVKPYFGAKDALIINEAYKFGFGCELSGIGGVAPVLTTPPAVGTLLRGCYMTQTVVNTVGSECVRYAPHDDIDYAEALTIYFYRHGILHKSVDCIGTWSLDLKTNEFPKFKFEFTGTYAGPEIGVLPTITTFANHVAAPIFRSAQFTLDNYAAVIETLKIDLKGDIAKRTSANAATGILNHFMKDRQMSAEIDPEVPDMATKDFWAMWAAAQNSVMNATIGQVAGNRCLISAPNVQIDDIKYADRENILTYGMPLRLKPTAAGHDEITLTFN